MPETVGTLICVIAVVLLIFIALLAVIIASGYVKAPPDTAYIISGFKKEPKVLIGRAGIKLPFLERKDMLPESVEVEFERKAHVLDGLLEFLQWREDAIDLYFNEAAIERKRKTHIEKTRENSTRWNHDPFVFE